MSPSTSHLRYEDRDVALGASYSYRLGIVDGDAEVLVGEVWATAETPVFAREGARPNPTSGRELIVHFVLPSAEAAQQRRSTCG